ncbi:MULTISPECIES: DUF1489 domain-containing protein [unclassified Minwuia]|jgi:hypothetical protein|uniref:DUF1489 family protein n=1 Tax=unclassified Minwuia TaxID=2618799 RepID=UPI002479800F|nr:MULTISPECIES: DUF1489 domain-containing protein [unclassified Minwuia]
MADRKTDRDAPKVVHLLKICVGVDQVEQLELWQGQRVARGEPLRHVTRSRPRRDAEVLAGGSLYWIIAGAIRVRQRIVGLDRVETDTGIKCGLVLDPELVRTEPWLRRPHQGWRYLEAKDAPPDLSGRADAEGLPPELQVALRDIGVY